MINLVEKKFTIYKTTNKINGNYYIGKHETYNVNDSYLGSGIRLKNALKFYGKENFFKEILFIFDNENDMIKKEIELVDLCFDDDKCYNLGKGGKGGNIVLFKENPNYKNVCNNISKGLLAISNKKSKQMKEKWKNGSFSGMRNKTHSEKTKNKLRKEYRIVCSICGTENIVIGRKKTNKTCSRKCNLIHRSRITAGRNNPRYNCNVTETQRNAVIKANIKRKNSYWVNNGIISRMIAENSELPEGFIRGRI